MTVRTILKRKGNEVFTILSSDSVEDAVNELVKRNVSALLVMGSDSQVAGIISERDIIRKVVRKKLSIEHTAVDKVMSKRLVICFPDDSLEYVQKIMTELRIRHIPVFESERLIGLISIGDVVKERLESAHVEIKFLDDYIQGRYPG